MNKNIYVLGIGEVLWDMLPGGKQCGGAPANVIYHLNKLGINGILVSAVGSDALGDELLAFLNSRNITTDFISKNNLETGVVDVTVSNGIPTYDIKYPSAWDAITLPDKLAAILPEVSALIFGSLSQRDERSRLSIQSLLEKVPSNCLKIFDINLRQSFYNENILRTSLNFADILKINDEELVIAAQMFGIPGDTKDILRALKEKFCLKSIILTLGANGSMFFDGENFTSYPVGPCNVVDTVGCGDSFLAGWCCAILNGKSPDEAMRIGSEISAYVASHAGGMC
ncbi:MAG: carbohydrate kinase [Lentisphaeria bacterium]|nr:carbohydrate kinase [Lentisphaeria bacterium]